MRTGILAALLAWSTLAAGGASASQPLDAVESAPALVLGEVLSVEPLLHAGYLASLRIERSLRGDTEPEGRSDPPGAQPGAPVAAIAWEEPVPSLPPRWAAGDRLLVALEPLPTASIWKQRVPDPVRRSALVAVAAGGRGVVEQPSPGTLLEIEHYLALSPEARMGESGALRLARLAARGEPELALACVHRLGEDAIPLPPGAARSLVEALIREDAPAVGQAVIDLAARRRAPALGDALGRAIGHRPEDAPTRVLAAKAAIDGRLDAGSIGALLASDSAERRAVAARWAPAPSLATLRSLARLDGAPEVRAAAVRRLGELAPREALHDVLRRFDDPAPGVRLAAAQTAAGIGADARPDLLALVDAGSDERARTAIAALSLMDAEAHRALARIAREHDDPGIRALAAMATGQPIGHSH